MNEKTKSINMINTNFVNPDGIDDDNHYTTINDLLLLSIEIINNYQLISILSKPVFYSDASGKEKTYENTNLLISDGFNGIKTGWTNKAGLTFIGFNQNNNRQIITIVNNSIVDIDKYNHFLDTKILYELTIDTYKNHILISKDTNIYTIRNSFKVYNHKSKSDWSEFININNKNNIKFDKYDVNNIRYTFNKYIKNYKVISSDKTVHYQFDPIKIFKIFAND